MLTSNRSLGIGTPSAAASGVIAANTMTNVENHIRMLKETAAKVYLYIWRSYMDIIDSIDIDICVCACMYTCIHVYMYYILYVYMYK